jgi:hypothetical protein
MAEEEEFEKSEEDEEEQSSKQPQNIREFIDQSPSSGFRAHSLSEIVPVLNQAKTSGQGRQFIRVISQGDDQEEEEAVSYDSDNQKGGIGGVSLPRNEYRPQDDYASSEGGDYSSFSSESSGVGESREVFGNRAPSGAMGANWGNSGMDSIGRESLSGSAGMGNTSSKDYDADKDKRMKDKRRTM